MSIRTDLMNCKVSYGNYIADGEPKSGWLGEVLNKLYKDYDFKFTELKKMNGWKLDQDPQKVEQFKKYKKDCPWILINSPKGDKCKEIINHYIIIDIDDLEINDKDFAVLNSFPFVVGSGVSCSGVGYYSVIKFSPLITEEYEFKYLFSKLEEYYKEKGYVLDPSCKNPNRKRILSPYNFKFNDNFQGYYNVSMAELDECKPRNNKNISYNFKPDESYNCFNGEIKSGVIGSLGGNEARINVASCIKKYFPDDYLEIINNTFSGIEKNDLLEMINSTKYEKSGICVKAEVRNWCFDNLPVFEPLKKKNKIIWGEEQIELTEFLNNKTKDLVDKNIEIPDNKFLADVINFDDMPQKVIINSPCGSGKSYWVKTIFNNNKKVKLYCPYKSIQSVYYKELEDKLLGFSNPFSGQNQINNFPEPRNIESLKNKDIKRGDILIIDEAHLFMVDSQYRDIIGELEKICTRKDIKIVLLTGTPSKEYLKQLKAVGFNYWFCYYGNKNRYKNVDLLNLSIDNFSGPEDIIKTVKYIIQDQEKNYDALLLCTNIYHQKFKNAVNLFEPARIICSENYNSGIKEVREFCRGEKKWSGLYLLTRYGFAGIDYKGAGKYCCITFNSEINLPDLIQLSNRFRKGEVDIINIVDGDFNQTENKINNIFSIAYADLLADTKQNQVKSIGYNDFISTPENNELKNIDKFKRKALYNYKNLKKNGKDIYYKGEVIKYDGEEYNLSWDRLADSFRFDFSENYSLFKNILEVRENEDDEVFLKYIFQYDKINKLSRQVEVFDNYQSKTNALSYYYGSTVVFGGWELDYMKNEKYEVKEEKIITDLESGKLGLIDSKLKNYLLGLDKVNYKMKMEQIARVIIKIDDSFNFSISFRSKYQGEKIYRDIIKELEKENIVSFNNPDPDKWFNEEVEIITDKGTEIIKIHNPRKENGRIGKAVGRALNYKFVLNTDNDIKFRNRKEAFEYCQKNFNYKGSFRSWDRDYKNYVSRIA